MEINGHKYEVYISGEKKEIPFNQKILISQFYLLPIKNAAIYKIETIFKTSIFGIVENRITVLNSSNFTSKTISDPPPKTLTANKGSNIKKEKKYTVHFIEETIGDNNSR
jgi:hypothetical protein